MCLSQQYETSRACICTQRRFTLQKAKQTLCCIYRIAYVSNWNRVHYNVPSSNTLLWIWLWKASGLHSQWNSTFGSVSHCSSVTAFIQCAFRYFVCITYLAWLAPVGIQLLTLTTKQFFFFTPSSCHFQLYCLCDKNALFHLVLSTPFTFSGFTFF